jgi:hypothetical protein
VANDMRFFPIASCHAAANPDGAQVSRWIPPVNARFVRIKCSAQTAQTFSIYSLRIFGE